MKLMNGSEASAFLSQHGVYPENQVAKVLRGFDLSRPMYEHDFWHGDKLYQFVRMPSAGRLAIQRGSWYGLSGINMKGVAIFSGLAGRALHKFEVIHPFSALEGISARLPIDWQDEIGGQGGMTQVFVPRMYAGHISSLGPTDPV